MDDAALATLPGNLSSRLSPTSPAAAPWSWPSATARPAAVQPTGHDLALAGIAHDARNLVTSLQLCADLIGEPGVLAAGEEHFAEQLRTLAEAAGYVVRRLTSVCRTAILASEAAAAEMPVEDLAGAVGELKKLLCAIAGPAITVEVESQPCTGRLRLTEEGLTRILLNLVRNAADVMPLGGHIRITTRRGENAATERLGEAPAPEASGYTGAGKQGPLAIEQQTHADTVVLTLEDDGPGIPEGLLERIFEPGFSTHRGTQRWPGPQHHGLGLSIVRELVEAAGGSVRAAASPGPGARFELIFPLTNVTPSVLSIPGSAAVGGEE